MIADQKMIRDRMERDRLRRLATSLCPCLLVRWDQGYPGQ